MRTFKEKSSRPATLVRRRAAPAVAAHARTSIQTVGAKRLASCACGGGCPNCGRKATLQTKLKVGPPDDIYEQEADRMAEVVIGMSQQRNNSQPHEHGSQVGDDKLILRKPGGQGSEKRANNR